MEQKIEFGQEFINNLVLSALEDISTCWYVNVNTIVYHGWRESYLSYMDLLKVAVVGKVGKRPKYTGGEQWLGGALCFMQLWLFDWSCSAC